MTTDNLSEKRHRTHDTNTGTWAHTAEALRRRMEMTESKSNDQ